VVDMVNKKGTIIKNSFKFTLSNAILRVSQIIQGIFVANLLGPTLFGLKNAIQLVLDYGGYLHLGSLNGFYRERQKNEFINVKKRNYYTHLIFSFLIIAGILFFIVSILCFVFLNYSFTIRASILIIGLLVPTGMFLTFLSIILQSKTDFNSLSVINLMQAGFVLFFIIIFVYFFGVIGYFLGTLLGSIIILVLRWYKAEYIPQIIINSRTFTLLKKSFYLFLFNFAYLVFFSVDRIFVINYFGEAELGYYAVGLFFANLMYFFISSLVLPVVPQIYQNIKNKRLLIKYIVFPTRITQNLIYSVVFLTLFLYPFLIFILPKYATGFLYVNILIFSVMFYPELSNKYFIGANKERFLLWFTSIFVFFAIFINFLVIIFDLPPLFIAISTMVALFLYGTITNLLCYKELLGSWNKALKEVFNYLWPLGYALIGYGLLWILAHFWLYGFMNYYVVKVIQAILFTIWYAPILWKLEKKHKILKIICEYIKGKLRPKFALTENPKTID